MKTLKTVEELVIKHAISKNFYGYGNGKFHCQIHYPELCKIITEDRQSIVNKIKEMIEFYYKVPTRFGQQELTPQQSHSDVIVRMAKAEALTELKQWIEGGSDGLER